MEIISFKEPTDNKVCVWITYLTTTPKNKIEISFYDAGDSMKGNLTYDIAREVPKYFTQYDNGPYGWKDTESIGLLEKKLANGTSKSPTLNTVYDNVQQIINRIKIQVKE